jgi:hypothetical protein
VGSVFVTHLVPPEAGETVWLFAAGPAVFVVTSLSGQHGRGTVEQLVTSAVPAEHLVPCA